MKHEMPINVLLGGIDTYELLWEYNGGNFIQKELTDGPYDTGVYIELDLTGYSLLYILSSSFFETYDGRMLMMINDPSDPYDYIMPDDRTGNMPELYRFVKICEHGLYFSCAYFYDGTTASATRANCCPYRIYGIR